MSLSLCVLIWGIGEFFIVFVFGWGILVIGVGVIVNFVMVSSY